MSLHTDPTDIKIIARHYYEPFYANKFANLDLTPILVAQWLRIRLPMQGTRVQALVQEDPTCRGATKPVCCNY